MIMIMILLLILMIMKMIMIMTDLTDNQMLFNQIVLLLACGFS